MEILNAVLAAIVEEVRGNRNRVAGMLALAMIAPMGVGLQEPVRTCWPFVKGTVGVRAQWLMKLLVEVIEGTCPAS
jgi:hypothetical protein